MVEGSKEYFVKLKDKEGVLVIVDKGVDITIGAITNIIKDDRSDIFKEKNNMKNSLLIIYTIILITTTVFNSGYFLDLKDYCVFRESNLSSMYILLIVLFGLCFQMGNFFEKKGYNGLTLIYTLPVVLLLVSSRVYYLKRDKLLLNSKVIIDRAIIVEKSNSKFSWHAISRFKINKSKDSISKYFKINGSLLKKKKIGDTILIKYVLECPNIATDYNFSPTQEEIKYYKGGKVIYPVKN